jgi:hypothetical protein
MEQAAQQQQQPSAADQALAAQTRKLDSEVELNKVKGIETLAGAQLKDAQAQQLGGPASAPEVPSGLHDVEIAEKAASADLKRAQAENMRHGIGEKKIRLGHDLEMGRRQQDNAERMQ